jgi:Protein of unknown function (DUF3667)
MRCPNCGSEHIGEFCNVCGQSNVDLHMPIGGLVREATEEALGLDSRLRHTVVPFFFKPGEVTRDYLSGRRVRYTSPLKMYVVAAAIFFFAFAQHPHEGIVQVDPSDKAAAKSGSDNGRVDRYFNERLKKLDQLGKDEASKELTANMGSMLPKALIFLLPIFALLLKLFWRKRYYAEHLVFALHYHAFALVLLAPGGFLSGKPGKSATDIALVVCIVYLFLALRRVFGGSKLRTLAKLSGLVLLYTTAVGLGIAAAGLASLAFL